METWWTFASFNIIYYLSKLFGLTPNIVRKKNCFHFHLSKLQIMYSVLFHSVICLYPVITNDNILLNPNEARASILNFASVLVHKYSLAQNAVTVILIIVYNKTVAMSLTACFDLCKKFEKRDIDMGTLTFILYINCGMVLPWVVTFLVSYSYGQPSVSLVSAVILTSLVVNTLFIVDIQFLRFVAVLRQLFAEINFELESSHRNKSQVNVRFLASLHENLCSVGKMVNGVYSMPLLMSIVLVFFYLTFCCFLSVSKVMRSESIYNSLPPHILIIFLYYLFKTIFIIYECKTCSSQVKLCSICRTIEYDEKLAFRITIWQSYINNLREKFSPRPGFELGSPTLRAGALTNLAAQMTLG